MAAIGPGSHVFYVMLYRGSKKMRWLMEGAGLFLRYSVLHQSAAAQSFTTDGRVLRG